MTTLQPYYPADEGHRFRISVALAGSSKVVGEEHHHDTEFDPDAEPMCIEVRAWNLSEALDKARRVPLDAWFPENDEGTENRCPAGCGRFVRKGGHCSLEIRVFREGAFVGWEHR